MFGYLRPRVPELKVSEYHRYRACYCGLCRALRRQNGQVARLSIQYDVAVLAMLLSDLAGERDVFRPRRCVARPVVRHSVREETPVYRYCADMGVLLAHRRAQDGWRDERLARALAARAGLHRAALAARARRRAVADKIDGHIARLLALENERCHQMDLPAEAFGGLLEGVALGCPGLPEDVRQPLGWLARQLGRWLYLVDALDDWERDHKQGSYNPLLLYEDGEAARALAAEACRWAAGQAAQALDILPLNASRAVMENILYAGMPAQLDRILEKGRGADGRPV